MSSDPEIIMLLREIRDLLADDRREQHDAQPAHRPAPHPIPEDGGRARQTPTDPWHSPDWDDVWANGWYVGARAAEERALRAEALVRAKDETIGELLDQVTCRGHYEWRKWWDEEDQCLSGGFFPVNS